MDINQQTIISRHALAEDYLRIRKVTEKLCEPLEIDDYQLQSIAQTSPPKWHIAHVSWLFETFILSQFKSDYRVFDARFDYVFNSYYVTHGQMHARANRSLLSRPTVKTIFEYRRYVDEHMLILIQDIAESAWSEFAFFTVLGLNHEQQHQELLLMDVKHNFFCNPLLPAYRDDLIGTASPDTTEPMNWLRLNAGIAEMGHDGAGFCYDNETPRHPVLLRDVAISDRYVSNQAYLEFIADGGYQKPELWLSDGWAWLNQEHIRHPLYWIPGERAHSDDWQQFTLGGLRTLSPQEPVCHVSFYEADAYARWSGHRLPLECEIEIALSQQNPTVGNFMEQDRLHPAPANAQGQWFGDLWGWTASPYSPYPGFQTLAGSIGEYNGKFMANQMVLRGSSCVTAQGHSRASYRNFFYLNERWAFTGIRLARDEQ